MNKNPRSSFAVNHGHRTPHRNCSHKLCVCNRSKKEHYNNALGHIFKEGNAPNTGE